MSKNKKSLISLFFGVLLAVITIYSSVALFAPEPAGAQLLTNACIETGNCRFCDVVSVAVRLGRWLIAGAGGLALVIIVWAGVGLATSAGNQEKISAAKKQIVGAFFGMGITLVAFQLVSFVILMLAVPSSLQTFAEGESEAALKSGGLVNFLGVPWWSICDQSDLVKESGAAKSPSTANCAFWGDGTKCKANDDSRCCQGACTAPGTVCSYTKKSKVGIDNSAPAERPFVGTVDIKSETSVRNFLDANGVKVAKPACDVVVGSNSCSNDATTGGVCKNCVRVAYLPELTLTKLIKIRKKCNTNCVNITGGTEPGHRTHGPNINIVDIAYDASALTSLNYLDENGINMFDQGPNISPNNKYFGIGYTCEGFDSAGNGIVTNCTSGTTRWFHLVFD